MTQFSSMNVDHDSDTRHLTISHQTLIDTTVRKFNMENAKSLPTPIGCGVRVDADEVAERFKGPYAKLVVSIFISQILYSPTFLSLWEARSFQRGTEADPLIGHQKDHEVSKMDDEERSNIQTGECVVHTDLFGFRLFRRSGREKVHYGLYFHGFWRSYFVGFEKADCGELINM